MMICIRMNMKKVVGVRGDPTMVSSGSGGSVRGGSGGICRVEIGV